MLAPLAGLVTPLALLPLHDPKAVIAGSVLAGGLGLATTLLAMAGRKMDGASGVWLLALPWAVRFGGLAVITALAAATVPDLARGLVCAAGVGCIATLLVDLYRQVTARV